jgi:hypothetical protein
MVIAGAEGTVLERLVERLGASLRRLIRDEDWVRIDPALMTEPAC